MYMCVCDNRKVKIPNVNNNDDDDSMQRRQKSGTSKRSRTVRKTVPNELAIFNADSLVIIHPPHADVVCRCS